MRLELGSFFVREVSFGARTRLDAGHLEVNADDLVAVVLQDARLTRANVELVRPGEDARIVHVCDAVEPRCKVEPRRGAFPGFTGPIQTVGDGRTHRLAGVVVLETAELPWRHRGGIQIPREGILDVSGPAGALNPFADLFHLVLELDVAADLPDADCDDAVRRAGLRVADFLAGITRDLVPDELVTYELNETDPSLPRVAYLYQIASQGSFAGTFYYGGALDGLLPTLLHPNEALDGALVDGQLCGPSVRSPTYFHQNNPIITSLYRDHGRDLTFAGVILLRGHYYGMEDKYRVAQQAAKLARLLRADGVIASWESAGNALLEIMYTVQACEKLGIKSVLLTVENGGEDGTDSPLQFYVPEAVAMVSTGCRDASMELPRVARVVGGDTIRLRPEVGGERFPAIGPIQMSGRLELFAALGQAGWSHHARLDY
jgi:glycine reductase complex component B subunit alpha and beta